MKLTILTSIILSCFLLSCNNDSTIDSKKETTPTFQNKGHELVYAMVEKVGNYDKFFSKKDVVYTYTYQTADNKTNVSTEKYIFEGELSYGSYKQHEKTFPQLEGLIEQGFDGSNFWLKHNGKIVEDEALLKRVAFSRPTNFYWFTMMQKLLDPGLNYEQLEEETIDNKTYDVVKVSFSSKDDKPTDIYQLYINKETLLVDQFLFTVADFGKMEFPNLMKLEYEEVDGILMPTKRKYKKSTWNADVDSSAWTQATWSDIKFNTELSKDIFKK